MPVVDQTSPQDGAHPDRGLSREEKEAFEFFEASCIPACVNKKRVSVALIRLPCAKYILSNTTLSALGFCEAEPPGVFS